MTAHRTKTERSTAGNTRSALRGLISDSAGVTGMVIVASAVFAAIAGPLLLPHDPMTINAASRLVPPSSSFWLGTDELGRDVLSRSVSGVRITLTVAVTSITIAAVAGLAIGVLAAKARGLSDALLMRTMDVLFAFPAMLLALLVVAVMGPDISNLVVALAIVYTPAFARVARGATLAVLAESYIEGARSIGLSEFRLIRKYVLPNILADMSVQYTIGIASAAIIEASLSFLGLGVQPPTPSLGSMLNTAKPFLEISFWPSVIPGTAIFLIVMGFNLLGDGLRDVLDPRL